MQRYFVEEYMHTTDRNISEAVPTSTEVKRAWSIPQIEVKDLTSAETTANASTTDAGVYS